MAEAAAVWRKGPWTPQEDRLLIEYITQNGEGRWSSVFKCTGLKRSGKSCRLRWVNYLRPGLKKGQLTPQEEGIIIELHALWGNKWSTIARYLPGRTDNEIKNYWRTHFKIKRPSNFKQQKTKTILDQQQESQTVIGSNGFDQEVAFLSMDDIDEIWSRVDEESGSPDLIPTDCYLWGGLWNLDGGDHCSSNIQEQANDVANYCHPFEGDAVDHYVQSGEFLF